VSLFKPKTAVGLLSLTLILASCGSQTEETTELETGSLPEREVEQETTDTEREARIDSTPVERAPILRFEEMEEPTRDSLSNLTSIAQAETIEQESIMLAFERIGVTLHLPSGITALGASSSEHGEANTYIIDGYTPEEAVHLVAYHLMKQGWVAVSGLETTEGGGPHPAATADVTLADQGLGPNYMLHVRAEEERTRAATQLSLSLRPVNQ